MLEIKFGYEWNYKGHKGRETLFHTAIGNFLTALRDWAPAFRLIAHDIFEPFVERRFSSEGEGTWQTLAPATFRRKGDSRILSESGALRSSFQSGGGDHVEEITRQSLRWGSSKPYVLFPQTGTGKGFQRPSVLVGPGTGRGMAMRKILVMDEPMKRRIRSTMVGRLAQLARQEGYRINQSLDGGGISPLEARKMGNRSFGLE